MMLRHVLEWLAIRTQHFQHFLRNINYGCLRARGTQQVELARML